MPFQDDARIKRRLLLPILLAFFLLIGISIGLSSHLVTHHINKNTTQHLSELEQAFTHHIQENIQLMTVMLDVIGDNEQLQKNWLDNDRESLYQNALPLFESMRQLGIYHFFFIRPDASIFLRVHKPAAYDDTVNNLFVKKSAETGLPAAGITTCVIKKIPVLQAVKPWLIGDRLVGYIGINKDINQFAMQLHEELNLDLFITMKKDNSVVSDIPQSAPIPWPKDSPLVPIFSSLDSLPASAFGAINRFLVMDEEQFTDMTIDEKKYRLTGYPLSNGAGEEIAMFAVLDDITSAASLRQLLIRMQVILVVVGGGVFGFFFVYLGKIDKKLIQGRSRLQEAVQRHKVTADELEKLKNNLEKKVAEQTKALRNANEELHRTIIEEQEAQQKSRAAYFELEQIFEANTSGMRVLDNEHRVIRANRSFAKLVGLAQDEILGRKCSENFTCPHEHTPRCCFSQIVDGKEYVESEIEIIRSDGTPVWVFLTAAPYRNSEGGIDGVVQSFQDITLRKNAEESLIRANEEWKNTFHAMGDIVTIHDTEMRIVRANKAAMEVLDLPMEKIIGETCYTIFRGADLPCEGCPEALAMHDYRLHTAEIVHSNLKKMFLVSASPILDQEGACIGVIHMAKDITEQKNLEANLRQAQKMEAIGTLAGGVAHDFNNILSAIFGFTNLALENFEKGSQGYEDLQQVVNAAHRATDLVKQILSFSRKNVTEKAPLLPALIIKDILKFLRSSLPTSIEIRQDIVANEVKIFADPTQIYQVLMNLCINASHAMEPEGGVLEVEMRKKIVTENTTMRPGSYLLLRVSDTGHGIHPDHIEKIFDPFFTTKEKGKGTGMGLSVVHGIVKDHGGDILVRSSLGEGTTFQVFFPIIESYESEIAVSESPSLSRGTERILLVDDEEMLANLLSRVLESLGYEVVMTTSSRDALELFQANPESFDLVITDQTMPVMKGTVLAGRLLKVRPDIPIIICTGYSEELNGENAETLGIYAVLRKPVVNSELSKTIRQALNRT